MKKAVNVKLEIFIPPQFVDVLREELNLAGAGHIGDYDYCAAVSRVQGYYRPLDAANPYAGQVGQVSSVEEAKLEINCHAKDVRNILKAIRKVHPYEEPVINIIMLANQQFEDDQALEN